MPFEWPKPLAGSRLRTYLAQNIKIYKLLYFQPVRFAVQMESFDNCSESL